MITGNSYKYSSDDVLFKVFATKNNISKVLLTEERRKFFSRGQPCFRASPLTKRYGWGVHSNPEGKIVIYPMDSEGYKKFASDHKLKNLKAMRSKRA